MACYFHAGGKLGLQVEFIKPRLQHPVLPLGTEFLGNEILGSVPENEQSIPRYLLGRRGAGRRGKV